MAKVDLATGTTVADIVLQGGSLASTVSRNGQRAYAVLQTPGKVAVIDTANGTVITSVTVGSQPWSATLSPDDSRLYVVNTGSNTVSVIDTATDSVVATIPVASQPRQLAVSPDGTRGYLTASPGTLQVIDLANSSVLTSLVIGNAPNPIVLDAAGTRAYIGYAGDSTVRVLDTATNTIAGTVALGTNKAPNGLVLSPDQQTLYVSQFLADQVVEIDTTTLAVGIVHNVGSRPYGIDINADGTRVYVANRDSSSLSVIDTALHTVSTIALGSNAQPWAIGRFLQPEIVVAITSAAPPGGKWHTPYSFTVMASGVPAPTISLSSGTLPSGLTLGPNGVISGTPTQVGTFNGVLQAVSGSTTVTQPFSITIAPDWPLPPTIDNVVPGDGEVTVYFTPAPDDGNAPATMFNAFCGYASSNATSPIVVRGLPNGVPVTCTMNALNSAGGGVASAPFAPVTPGVAPAFDPFAPPRAAWNTPYSYTVMATGAPAPVLSIADGILPAGLSFDAQTGTISGTPTAIGSETVHLVATNAISAVTSGELVIVVDAVAPAAPASVVATPGNRQVSIAFAAPAHWGGEGAGSYLATCSPGGGTATGTASPLTVKGLSNGTAVTCAVSAINSIGAGPATAATPVMPRAPADLGVNVDNGRDFVAGGATVTYLIVVGNDGPNPVVGAQLLDEPDDTLAAITWTCAGSGGAICPAASGTGAISSTLDLPAGGSLQYSLSGSVPLLPETPLVHSVSVLAPGSVIDGNAANDMASDGPDPVGVFRDGFD